MKQAEGFKAFDGVMSGVRLEDGGVPATDAIDSAFAGGPMGGSKVASSRPARSARKTRRSVRSGLGSH